ncbi:hypothetical protein AM101_229 [Acinetobacter phage AM101]|uniref:Uncharacterized protein n=1 Tax=Acinetobacter phage AM101 TaxID=2178927 RepID=A0A4Y1NL51_9CAUD|nr:hypothetical protein HYP65_gp163 [Acinetobacter phage AM101]AWY10209.1 hypothetical protein AM101_229 [Acinetobacter phage AM101]
MNEHEKAISDAIASMRPTVLPTVKDELYKDCVKWFEEFQLALNHGTIRKFILLKLVPKSLKVLWSIKMFPKIKGHNFNKKYSCEYTTCEFSEKYAKVIIKKRGSNLTPYHVHLSRKFL